MRYGAVAFGDSRYEQLCSFDRGLDQRLDALGGAGLVPRTDCKPGEDERAAASIEAVTAALNPRPGRSGR